MQKLKILLLNFSQDDRSLLSSVINSTKDMEIVGAADDMQSGMYLIGIHTPEILLVQANPRISEYTMTVLKKYPETGIIILTTRNDPETANRIVDSLANGAMDFYPCYSGRDFKSHILLLKIRCCSIKRHSDRARFNTSPRGNRDRSVPAGMTADASEFLSPSCKTSVPPGKYSAIVVGVSTGGPAALLTILPSLPKSFPVPLIIVLHMPREFTSPMAEVLDRKSQIRVKEAEDDGMLERGTAYLAPGGFHSILERSSAGSVRLRIIDSPPVNNCKPSVDVLFSSAAPIYGKHLIGTVLTGMGNDGTEGSKKINELGGYILAQDKHSSIVWGMPGSVVQAGIANETLPLDKISYRLMELVRN